MGVVGAERKRTHHPRHGISWRQDRAQRRSNSGERCAAASYYENPEPTYPLPWPLRRFLYVWEPVSPDGSHTGADLANTNVNGGAIAIGHPLGASGARIMTTLVNALEQRGGRYALQTMCEGGGMANATIIERLS
jgi:hypothetical protein